MSNPRFCAADHPTPQLPIASAPPREEPRGRQQGSPALPDASAAAGLSYPRVVFSPTVPDSCPCMPFLHQLGLVGECRALGVVKCTCVCRKMKSGASPASRQRPVSVRLRVRPHRSCGRLRPLLVWWQAERTSVHDTSGSSTGSV